MGVIHFCLASSWMTAHKRFLRSQLRPLVPMKESLLLKAFQKTPFYSIEPWQSWLSSRSVPRRM